MTMVIIVMPVVAVVVASMLLLMLRPWVPAVSVEAPSLPPRVHG